MSAGCASVLVQEAALFEASLPRVDLVKCIDTESTDLLLASFVPASHGRLIRVADPFLKQDDQPSFECVSFTEMVKRIPIIAAVAEKYDLQPDTPKKKEALGNLVS